MPRTTPKPFWRDDRQRWMLQLDRKPVTLGAHPDGHPPPRRNKDGDWIVPQPILDAYHEKMGQRVRAKKEPPAPKIVGDGTPFVAVLLDDFLEYCHTHKAYETYLSYQERLKSFTDRLKAIGQTTITVGQLRPHHVREWADSHDTWSPGMKRGRMMAVQTALNWAVEDGRIDRSPVAKMKKPPQGKRENVITPERYEEIMGLVRNDRTRDLLTVSWEVGCRPQEILGVEARHVDLDTRRWVFPPVEAKGRKRFRIVYLNDKAMEITRRLVAEFPEGKLFRNTDGVPWDPWAVNSFFCRLEKKIGTKYALVDVRHSFCQRALKNGVDPVTLAFLMGHADTSMISRVYSHLSHDPDYLRRSLDKVNG